MPLTLVTAFLDIYKDPPVVAHLASPRTHDWRFRHFQDVASLGIPMYVFVSPWLQDQIVARPHIQVIPIALSELKVSTWFWNCLPKERNAVKDTAEFLQVQLAKTDFVRRAMDLDPTATHFAWIDFNVMHVVKNRPLVQNYLKFLTQTELVPDFLAFPGCWSPPPLTEPASLDKICWRFCGGFVIGSRDYFGTFCDLVQTETPRLLREAGDVLSWEVNVWASLEQRFPEVWSRFTWYAASHDDTLVVALPSLFTHGLLLGANRADDRTLRVPEPSLANRAVPASLPGNFRASNISMVKHENKSWFNIRFVNYIIKPDGRFVYKEGQILNRNVVCCGSDFYEEMDTCDLKVQQPHGISRGLEDIRLFVNSDNELSFIATNVDGTSAANRMILGLYDVESRAFRNCRILHPPHDDPHRCEKNWIPIRGINKFIYAWTPQMQIGQLDADNRLQITQTFDLSHLPWQNLRGSTIFLPTNDDDDDDKVVGLVHYSVETRPRRYYHVMVWLDCETCRPVRFSRPFAFFQHGIEFCTGFDVDDDKYVFWVSKFDRDPVVVEVSHDDFHARFVYATNTL